MPDHGHDLLNPVFKVGAQLGTARATMTNGIKGHGGNLSGVKEGTELLKTHGRRSPTAMKNHCDRGIGRDDAAGADEAFTAKWHFELNEIGHRRGALQRQSKKLGARNGVDAHRRRRHKSQRRVECLGCRELGQNV